MISELRPHQASALEALRDSIAFGRRRIVVQAPTGAGKTVIGAAIADGVLRKDKRMIFTVPAVSLVDQTVEAFWNEGIRDVGVIQGIHPLTRWDAPIQVASVQTLERRNIPPADVVVPDECHRWFKLYARWMTDPEWADVPFIGLSASPWTRGLGRYYEKLIVAATVRDLIAQGYLSPFRVFAPASPDLTGVRTVAGDYHEGDLSSAMDKPPLVADAVETWLKLGEGRPTLCFAVDRAHAQHLQERFNEAGVPCGYVDAYTTGQERKEIAAQFHRGELKVVSSVGTLTTGIDWDVRCIVYCRPTKSEMLWVQCIGRALRTAPGKVDALILDHSDTALRLGLPTDIHHDELDDGRKRDAEAKQQEASEPALPKKCSACQYVKPPKVHVCPKCGHKPHRETQLEFADGELVELKARATLAVKVSFMAQLRAYQLERGKKSGWSAHKYFAKFAVWPEHQSIREVAPAAAVSPEVRSWLKSQAIRWAKSKARAA